MKYLLGILILAASSVHGQSMIDQQAITATIHQLFDGMKNGDSSLVRSAFLHGNPSMKSIYKNKEGEMKIHQGSLNGFCEAVGTPHDEVWNEYINNLAIDMDGLMASAWMDYEFFLDDQFSHCGVNHMILAKSDQGWKIESITDTRRKSSCQQGQIQMTEEELIAELDQHVWIPFIQSYNHFDSKAFNSLHTDDMIRITDEGINPGKEYKQRIIKNFQSNIDKGNKRTIKLYFVNRFITANTAYEIGYYDVKVDDPKFKEPKHYYGQFHVVSKKINGRWYIVQDQDISEVNGVKVDASWFKDIEAME